MAAVGQGQQRGEGGGSRSWGGPGVGLTEPLTEAELWPQRCFGGFLEPQLLSG